MEDHVSTRIDVACPYCQKLFKVRLRKLQFGADLICRLGRSEFSSRETAERPEVRAALAHMHSRFCRKLDFYLPLLAISREPASVESTA